MEYDTVVTSGAAHATLLAIESFHPSNLGRDSGDFVAPGTIYFAPKFCPYDRKDTA